jgi:hypothetical protein
LENRWPMGLQSSDGVSYGQLLKSTAMTSIGLGRRTRIWTVQMLVRQRNRSARWGNPSVLGLL